LPKANEKKSQKTMKIPIFTKKNEMYQKSTLLYVFFSLFTFHASCVQAQTPTLVADLNVGINDGLQEYFDEPYGIQLGNAYLFAADNGTSGTELFVLKNNQITLLKDINLGAAASKPRAWVTDGKLVYFLANNASGLNQLYVTDGTATGTVPISVPSTAQYLVMGNDKRLYFQAVDSKMYYVNPVTRMAVSIATPNSQFDLEFWQVQTGLRAIPYRKGIAFVSEGPSTKLWYAQGDTIKQLGVIMGTDNYVDAFGLSQVGDHIVFGVSSSFDMSLDGTYAYNGTAGTLKRISPDTPIRILPHTSTSAIGAYDNGYRFILVSVVSATNQSGSPDLIQGQPLEGASNGVQSIVQGQESSTTFGDVILKLNNNNVSVLTNTESPFLSPFLKYGNDVWFASGINNGFKPILHHHNLLSNTITKRYTSLQSSSSNSLIPLCWLDGKMYFAGNVVSTTDIGREIYYLPTSYVVDTKEVQLEATFSIRLAGNTITIEKPSVSTQAQVRIYDLVGAQVYEREVSLNTPHLIQGLPSGMYLVSAVINNELVSQKVWLGE
jgi:ELWxxDGT repeat protein